MTATNHYHFADREVVSLGDRHVVDHVGTHHRGDLEFLCMGATLSGFASELFGGEPLRSVRLQMAETSPMGETLTTSVANGDSFRYYPAYRDLVTALAPPDARITDSQSNCCANSASTGASRWVTRTRCSCQ